MYSYLITGSTGFLGTILKGNLAAIANRVIELNDLSEERIDICSPFGIRKEMVIDVIVHAAGKAHSIPKSRNEVEAFYKVNLEGTKNLCNAIDSLSNKPKSFIFISTVSVYGLDKGVNINESFPLLGSSPYAKSKILAEEFLVEWAEKNSITLGILRLPLVAGPNPPGNLGAMIKGIRSGKYLSIGKANASKSIVWAEDIADIIPKLVEVGGTYNLTDGYNPSFRELESVISSTSGKPTPKRIPLPAARLFARLGDLLGSYSPINTNKLTKIMSTLVFDDSLARRKLGWKPSNILEKLEETL